MNVLWIVNAPLPEALSILQGSKVESHSTGSWVCALLELFCGRTDVDISIASPSPFVKDLVVVKGKATHYLFPSHNRYEVCNIEYESYWNRIYQAVKPDVVHIHGTEYPHIISYLNVCGNDHLVVSIQGLVSEIRHHYFAGMSDSDVKKCITLRDLVRHDSIIDQYQSMLQRGNIEVDFLSAVNNIIGRTDWDKQIALSINPSLKYYHCSEALREPFYSGKWNWNDCQKHTIFMTQGHYPLKGLHIVLEALPASLNKYPDSRLVVSGVNIMRGRSPFDCILRSGYANYLATIIRKNRLWNKVFFIGEIDAEGIKSNMLTSNVFLCASSIENSPNSVCEAQMLGVPCIASDVGGIRSIIPDNSCGRLYEYDSPMALANQVCVSFDESSQYDSSEEMSLAATRHNKLNIFDTMMSIYEQVAY